MERERGGSRGVTGLMVMRAQAAVQMIRKIAGGFVVVLMLVVGLVAQAGAYLFAFNASPPDLVDTVVDGLTYSEAGPYPVGVRRIDPPDAPMTLTVWYPAVEQTDGSGPIVYSYGVNMLSADTVTALATFEGRADPDGVADLRNGPYPVVVLSHGFAITPGSYGWLAEHLASYGMVVVAPHHHESLDPRVLWRATTDRPTDVRSVFEFLDRAEGPGGELAGLADAGNVATVGHSYGGFTALAAAGARMDTAAFESACDASTADRDPLVFLCDALIPHLGDLAEAAGLDSVPVGLWPSWGDSRVTAAVTVAGDAAMFGESGLSHVEVPVLAIGGTADTDSPFRWGTALSYENSAGPRKVEVALDGAAHLIFAGECERTRRILDLVSMGFCSDPAWDRSAAHAVVRHYVAAFLIAELYGDGTARDTLAPSRQQVADTRYRAEGW